MSSRRLFCALMCAAVLLAFGRTRLRADEAPPPADSAALQPTPESIREYLERRAETGVPAPEVDADRPIQAHTLLPPLEAARGDRTLQYRLVLERVLLADRLLAQKNVTVRRSGLALLNFVLLEMMNHLEDPQLTATVCATYYRPHFADASTADSDPISQQALLPVAIAVYRVARRFPEAIAACDDLMALSHTPNQRNYARLRKAQVYQDSEEYGRAILALEAIEENDGLAGSKRLIPMLREKFNAQQAIIQERCEQDQRRRENALIDRILERGAEPRQSK